MTMATYKHERRRKVKAQRDGILPKQNQGQEDQS
jgi:hypothetical protein